MKLFTIGFTQKTAEAFFTKLMNAGVKRIVDVRLNNVSQLAGFAKKDDMKFFAKAICGIEYIHVPELAPTQDMLNSYRKEKRDWDDYEEQFLDLMAERRIEKHVKKEIIEDGCLLCSEHKPHYCHRRLIAEYLQKKWGNISIQHIE